LRGGRGGAHKKKPGGTLLTGLEKLATGKGGPKPKATNRGPPKPTDCGLHRKEKVGKKEKKKNGRLNKKTGKTGREEEKSCLLKQGDPKR